MISKTNKNKKDNPTYKMERCNIITSIIASILTIASVLFGVNVISNNNNATAEAYSKIDTKFSLAIISDYPKNNEKLRKKLQDAQTAFFASEYETAYKMYGQYSEETTIAQINLGFIYSNNLVQNKGNSFDMACKYYKKAYENEEELGLENYIAINLLKPQSYKQTFEALCFGVEEGNDKAIQFASYFLCNEFNKDKVKNDEDIQNAKKFCNMNYDEAKKLMSDKLIISNIKIKSVEEGEELQSTDFVNYNEIDLSESYNLLSCIDYREATINTKENVTKNVLVPVYSSKVYKYYIMEEYSFKFADYICKEKFAQI